MPPKKLKSPRGQDHTLLLSFTVGQNGSIANAPTYFQAHSGDTVTWLVGNTSGQPITVTLTQFLRKKSDLDDKGDPNDQVQPFVWLVSNSIQLDDQQAGLIVGLRDPTYQIRGLLHDAVSYDIQVASRAPRNPFPTIDYDPCGDIKP